MISGIWRRCRSLVPPDGLSARGRRGARPSRFLRHNFHVRSLITTPYSRRAYAGSDPLLHHVAQHALGIALRLVAQPPAPARRGLRRVVADKPVFHERRRASCWSSLVGLGSSPFVRGHPSALTQ